MALGLLADNKSGQGIALQQGHEAGGRAKRVGPQGRPTDRQSAPMVLGNLSWSYAGADNVRITGTATNKNEFKVKNVVIAGVLKDASGQIVSLGETYVLEEDIAPNAWVRFDVRIKHEPFYRYQLYAQAERDWQ